MRPYQNFWGKPKWGKGTTFGAYVEFAGTAGEDCKIEAYVSVPPGVVMKNRVFIGPKVTFTNDKHPKAKGKWKLSKTRIEDDVTIGAGAVILPVVIGKGAVIGAGAVVTKNVPAGETWVGNPARKIENIPSKQRITKIYSDDLTTDLFK